MVKVMKFIHCSDLHLDSKIDALSSEKSKIRRDEIVRSFERLASYAVENSVVAIFIAGDMFDTTRITEKTKKRVLNVICSNPQVDFLYVSGNHDDDSFFSQIESMPKNLKIFSDSWLSYRYDDVVVSGVNFNSVNADSIFGTLNLNDKDVNIVLLHGQIVGYKSNEKAEIIPIPKLRDKNVDYLALGHIHSYSEGKIDNRGKYVYSGCLDGRGFDETGDKGFVLINVEDGKLQSEFVSFSSRQLHEFEFNVSGYENWFQARDNAIKDLTTKYQLTDLIKVVLVGDKTTDFDIDVDEFASLLNSYFFFAKVYDETQIKISLTDYEFDKSLKGEFVRAVWESDMEEQMKQRVIMCGIKALKGEEY